MSNNEINSEEIKVGEEELKTVSGGRTLGDLTCPYCGGNNFTVSTQNFGWEYGMHYDVYCSKCRSKLNFDQATVHQYMQ